MQHQIGHWKDNIYIYQGSRQNYKFIYFFMSDQFSKIHGQTSKFQSEQGIEACQLRTYFVNPQTTFVVILSKIHDLVVKKPLASTAGRRLIVNQVDYTSW